MSESICAIVQPRGFIMPDMKPLNVPQDNSTESEWILEYKNGIDF